MIPLTDQPPLLLPEPLFIELLSGKVYIGSLPLGITGVNEKIISNINTCITNLPAVNIGKQVFRLETNRPQIKISIDNQINKQFADKELNSKADFNGSEAYVLNINIQGISKQAPIEIIAGAEEGVQHALFTLVQLISQYVTMLPALVIRDMPLFPNRGYLWDISRDRVPAMSEILTLIDTLAYLKYNHLQLYTEHTFAYYGHETVWENATPLTAGEVQIIDAHCRKRGIVLAANQACFTHLTRWLKHSSYSDLAETNSVWEWEGNNFSGPFSLNPQNPASIELVADMLDQLLPNFSSGLININCDEAIDLGIGASKTAVAERGNSNVYWDFVHKIMDLARQHNFKPMFWADMWLKASKAERSLPDRDVISLVWGYEPSIPFGEMCNELIAYEREVWVCPGTSSWKSITGRTNERRANSLEAAVQGLNSGAKGYLLTEWGDEGHRQQFPISLFALAEAAQSAWSASLADQKCKAVSLHLFGDRKNLAIGKWLAELGNLDANIRQSAVRQKDDGQMVPLINASCLFVEMDGKFDADCVNGSLEEWSGVEANLNELANNILPLPNEMLNEEIRHILWVTNFAVQKAILRRRSPSEQPSGIAGLIKSLKTIITEHRSLWLTRSRAGGLEDSCAHYYRILEDLRQHA